MASVDHFFYAGMMDLRQEIMDDIETSLLVGSRTIPYFRDYGAGIQSYENEPISFSTLVKLRYDIASWLAKRNMYISDGNNNYPDRRAITSQMVVQVEQKVDNIDITVPILTLYDMDATNKVVSVSIGGNNG
jgi:hypothetical protein